MMLAWSIEQPTPSATRQRRPHDRLPLRGLERFSNPDLAKEGPQSVSKRLQCLTLRLCREPRDGPPGAGDEREAPRMTKPSPIASFGMTLTLAIFQSNTSGRRG